VVQWKKGINENGWLTADQSAKKKKPNRI